MTTKYKTTPWLDGLIKPVHIGVYERDHCGHLSYSYWNGTAWCWGRRSVNGAAEFGGWISQWQELPWRGVLKP